MSAIAFAGLMELITSLSSLADPYLEFKLLSCVGRYPWSLADIDGGGNQTYSKLSLMSPAFASIVRYQFLEELALDQLKPWSITPDLSVPDDEEELFNARDSTENSSEFSVAIKSLEQESIPAARAVERATVAAFPIQDVFRFTFSSICFCDLNKPSCI